MITVALSARLALWLLIALATGAGEGDGAAATLAASADRIRAQVEFLADDDLRGREPGTPGYALAASYVATEFWRMGLEPAGTDGGWFQPVPLRSAHLVPGSAELSVWHDGRETALRFPDDFYRPPDTAQVVSRLRARMVFAGYGIHAPVLGHDDYATLDVRDKVVVMLSGRPAEMGGEAGAHFGTGQRKREAALAHGAVGVITVFTPRNERLTAWIRQRERVGEPAMDRLTADGNVANAAAALQGRATVHHSAAGVLFGGSGHQLGELLARDEAGEPLPVFELAGEVAMAQRSRHHELLSPNVAAVAPGTDPALADEFVLYVAHLDHLGSRRDGDGELRIHNGAVDNAAGVAVMLETANAFMSEPHRRSVLFLAVTAEETGLVGSGHFAARPTVPIGDIVTVINLDMPLLLYAFTDVLAVGAEHSNLIGAVARAAVETDVALAPDPFPARNIFVRSDHYPFVQRGIPSIFLVTGPGGPERRHLSDWDAFLGEHYHGPTDTVDLAIDWDAAARFAWINYRIGWYVSELTERPRWNDGDFFGETFAPAH